MGYQLTFLRVTMPKSSDPNSKPVTTRAIAARAGVSNATVSLALRNHPRISSATREKVRRAADELGYRPDPQIAKLMHHLRLNRGPGFQSTIAALTTIPESLELDYLRDIHQSAKARAESLGYAFMLMRVSPDEAEQPALQRILSSRGVEGLLVLPLQQPAIIEKWLKWEQFATVTATYSVTSPEFHRVVPHQFGNALRICRELAGLGYRRIGLVQASNQDLAVHHGFSAAVTWQNLLGGTEMVQPLLYQGQEPEEVEPWFKQERPDVIITSGAGDSRMIARQLGLEIPGPVGFAVMNWYGQADMAGIDEHPSEIGQAAADLLHSKIINGSFGIPKVPTLSMVSGRWVPGPSVHRMPPIGDPAPKQAPRAKRNPK